MVSVISIFVRELQPVLAKSRDQAAQKWHLDRTVYKHEEIYLRVDHTASLNYVVRVTRSRTTPNRPIRCVAAGLNAATER